MKYQFEKHITDCHPAVTLSSDEKTTCVVQPEEKKAMDGKTMKEQAAANRRKRKQEAIEKVLEVRRQKARIPSAGSGVQAASAGVGSAAQAIAVEARPPSAGE